MNKFIIEKGVVINRLRTVSTLLFLCFGFSLTFQLSKRGIDFSDEGKYLLDARYPDVTDSIITHYGYVHHHLFSLLNYDVALFRFSNFLITFSAAAITTSFILKYLGLVLKQISYLSLNLSIISGIVSLTHFSVFWLPTPSYNSLTFQLMIFCLMAMARFFYQPESKITLATSVLVALPFALLFLAKPPAFLILVIALLFVIKTTLQLENRILFLFITFVFMWISFFSYLIYHNILEIYESIWSGIWYAQKLTDTYSTKSQVSLDIPPSSILIAVSCGFIILLLFFRGYKHSINLLTNFWILLTFSLVLIIVVVQFQDHIFATLGNSFLIITAFFFVGFAMDKINFRSLFGVNRIIWITLILPFACAAGTNNNIWIQGSMNFYFVYLFGLFFLLHFKPNFDLDRRNYLIFILIMVVSLSSITSISHKPYRQISSLSENNTQLSLLKELDGVKVTEDVELRIRKMLSAMRLAGFEKGTSVIDFSGQSPTLLFIAQAFPAGDSWLVGGYEGSDAYAIERLSAMSCRKLRSSWLLIELGGPKSLNHKIILNQLGIDFSLYRMVSTWRTPEGAGGYPFSREQVLYRPFSNPTVCDSSIGSKD